MQPPVRSYNSSSPTAPRRRGGRSGKRAQPAISSVSSSEGLPREGTPAASAMPDVLPDVLEAHAAVETAAPSGDLAADVDMGGRRNESESGALPLGSGTAEAGPVVGVADFEEIFTRFQTPLTNFVFRLVGNREQAYDLTQDVFVKAYRALAAGTTIQAAALSSWLYRIASNTATDALRRRRLIAWLPLSLFNEDRGVGAGMPGSDNANSGQPGGPDESFSGTATAVASGTFASAYDGGRFEQHVADRELVQTVLDRLPEKYRVCLLLYEHEGFSCAEIAEVLSLSPSAVKMRLMRARERFIALYKQETGKS